MKKLLTLIFWIILPAAALWGQEEDEKLYLQSSSHSRIDGTTGHMVNYMPVYSHKGSTLRADSGYVYTDSLGREYFDAFGNVTITQPNNTMIFANKLNYAAETQLAILTGNVRMVDGGSVLTTNFLTYNMKSDIGTYSNGGRIINERDTIVSERAWYFNNTQDAYFRLNVIVRTPDVQIYTDTMRYNSNSKTTFFYGPTNIKGKNGENLYTEEGHYNTETELAEFYKNNLYTEKSRLLRGDTLYYDGSAGIGRALSNVMFIDTADQFFVEGMVGLYTQEDESILMTERALVTLVVNEDESSPGDSVTMGTDSLGVDTLLLPPQDPPARVDSVYLTADTLYSIMIYRKDYIPMEFDLDREGGAIVEDDPTLEGLDDPQGLGELSLMGDSTSLMGDSTRAGSLAIDRVQNEVADLDSTQTTIDSTRTTIDSTRTIIDSTRTIIDSTRTIIDSTRTIIDSTRTIIDSTRTIQTESGSKVKQPPAEVKYEDRIRLELEADSTLRKEAPIPKGGEVDSLLLEAAVAMSKPRQVDSIPTDSLANDTSRTRIVKAYRNVRLYKSDLQSVADSAYYGYADSMMRFFGSPMAWTQGSQLSGDSLFLQIKNEKIDNILILSNAFIVNTKLDSSKYNQIKGRKITGFFTNSKLERVFVDGNAENIVYRENEEGTGYTDMYHSRSARIKILVENNELTDFIPIKSTEGTIYPLALVPQEREILEGFVWKPGDRPTSKEDLLSRKRVIEQEIIRADETDSALDSTAIDGRPTDAEFQDLPSDPDDQVTGMTTNGEQAPNLETNKTPDAEAEAAGESGEKKIEPAEFVPLGTTATDLHSLRVKKLTRLKSLNP